MSIESTRDITRKNAIERIQEVTELILECNYKKLEEVSNESDYRVDKWLHSTEAVDISAIDKWTDRMIEDLLDQLYYRYSMFDNYLIRC